MMTHEPQAFWYKERPNLIKLVGKYQHEASVHIIGAISRRGRSKLMIFTGRLNSDGFQDLCDQFLIPFIREKYPLIHRVQMDNAKSHSSYETRRYIYRNMINHFPTPAQSPDLNPIELVWNDLKNHLANDMQPRTVQELTEGINNFWETTVTIDYCNAKIIHLHRVIQHVMDLNGNATGI